jgi:3-phosphoinositide dependent protein kinase-1
VKIATHYATGQEYAIKILDKGHLKRYKKTETALAEKNTLVRLGSGHPGIVRLHWTFQDEWSLFFVLDVARNGEMQSRISRLGSLSTACSRYYSAQIVDALDYMHTKGVIHRDLKPENLLLDDAFRIKITDFGTGKLLEPGVERAETFVGTPQYFSPELLEHNQTSKSSDLWALGCIIYQMIAGRFAFSGQSHFLTWQKIKQLDYSFPEGFDPEAKDLIQKLIVRDPMQRLGAGPPGSAFSMQSLRSHHFFASINWKTLWADPAPPLESGLVKREHPLMGQDQNWDDVGAAWDDIAEADDDYDGEGDGIRWADDAEGPAYIVRHGYQEGHMGELQTYGKKMASEEEQAEEDADTVMGHESPASLTVTAVGEPEPIDVPAETGSGTSSSSDGSPIEKLGAALEAMRMARGRTRAQTPIQGNGPSPDIDWSSLLLPYEKILFNSQVEARCVRRRASRLIPLAVSPLKSKSRQLILTSHRLVCVKQRERNRDLSVKSELVFQDVVLWNGNGNGVTTVTATNNGKEKDSRSFVVGVKATTDREFVIQTSGKSQTYTATNTLLASSWVQNVASALESHKPAVRT